MTTIAAIQGDGYAVVATDSRISEFYSEGSSQVGTLNSSNGKVANNGKYILGAAGDLRAINLLHHAFSPPACPPNIKGKKLDRFITTKFIPALRLCFEEQGYATPDKDSKMHIAEHDSQIICIINCSIYIIDGDYSWYTNNTGLYSIGSGSSYAIGALTVITSNGRNNVQTAKKAVTKAIGVAARFDPHTGGPYTTYTQESAPSEPKSVPIQKIKTTSPQNKSTRKKTS